MKSLSPILKRYRALGESFALAADRAVAEKFKKAQRKLPPGMHGKRSAVRKLTQYGLQLLEKQKAQLFYLLSEKQLKNYYLRATKKKGSSSETLLSLLESRLDNLVYRSGAADSHRAARQLIAHGHLLVNGRKINIASYQVRAGDRLSFEQAPAAIREMVKNNLARRLAPPFLKVEPEKLSVEVLRAPLREEIETPVDEKLIIEFYSR